MNVYIDRVILKGGVYIILKGVAINMADVSAIITWIYKTIDEILHFGIVDRGRTIIFGISFIIAFVLASYIACSNITPTFPQDYFSQIANACIVVLSVFIATIYAVIAIIIQKDTNGTIKQRSKIGNCITVSIIPFFGIGASLFSLIISAFSIDVAREFLAVSVLLTIISFGITYLVMVHLVIPNGN